ncbi:hypothetical protein GCM10023080_080320 [Streptomyces pseudoechinosporeus]
MAPRTPERGRLFRRCGCRRPDGRQFGAACPKLKGRSRHGSWAFAVDLPSADGRRKPHCRSGFPTRKAAHAALERTLTCERTGLYGDEGLALAASLTDWLRTKKETLKPTTFVRYRDYVRADLIPSFGRIAIVDLRPRHITAWQEAELARGRGRTTVYRIGATLSSALGSAVRTRLIADNPCRYAMTPRPAGQERICWNPTQAAAFLRHNHTHYADQLADCSSCCWVPACAAARPWACTGPTSTCRRRPCWCDGISRPSTTTGSTSATPRPGPAGTG